MWEALSEYLADIALAELAGSGMGGKRVRVKLDEL
jgi:hypothetical protein